MSEFCSCGAQLPPDAVFCHKCGKPQREIVAPEIETHAAVPPPPPPATRPPEPLPLNFSNKVAVRIAMLVALGATVLSISIPFISWAAAGFVAVLFYKRKTGSFLNVTAGVRMGWITGLLMYALWAVVFVTAALTGKFSALLQENMKNLAWHDPVVRQMMINFVQSGPGVFTIFVLTLGACFFFITGLSIAGGALCAKVVGGD